MILTETLRGIPLIFTNPVNRLSQAWYKLMARVERDRLQELAEIHSNVFELFTNLDEARLPNLALTIMEAIQEHPSLDAIMGKAPAVDVEVKAKQGSGTLLKWVASEVIEQVDHPLTLRLILTEPLAEARGIWEARLNTPLAAQRLGQIQIVVAQLDRIIPTP